MKLFVERYLRVYPREYNATARSALLFLLVFLFFAIFRNYVDASFIKRYGPGSIPLMLCMGGALSLLVFSICRRLGARVSDRRMLIGFLCGAGLAQAGLYLLVSTEADLVYPLLYLLMILMDAFLLVYLWNLTQEMFDARQGKRLFRLFMLAQVVGGTLGSLASGPLALALGIDAVLLPCAAANVLLAGGLFALWPKGAGARVGRTAPRQGLSMLAACFERYPIFRFLCACAVLPNLILPILTYQFGVVAEAAFASEQELLSFLGWFRGATTCVTFAGILALGGVYDRLSTRSVAMAAPLNQCFAFSVMAVFFNLWAAAYAQFSTIFLQRAALGPLTKRLHSLLPREIAAWSQIVVRGMLCQASTIGGALLIIALKPEFSARQLSVLAIVLALVWAWEAFRFRRGYGAGLKQVMAEKGLDFDRFGDAALGHAEPEEPEQEVMSPETYPEAVLDLVAELDIPDLDQDTALPLLRDPEEQTRAAAAASFALSRDCSALNPLLGLLDDTEPVRRAAVDALSRYGAEAAPLLEQALPHSPPRVQRGILEVMRLARLRDADITPFLGRMLTAAYHSLMAARTLERGEQGASVDMLLQHLHERRLADLDLVFLGLWVRHKDMRLVFEAVNSGDAAAAVELLEAVLDPVTASRIVPLVDSIPDDERIARGRRVLPLRLDDTPARVLHGLCADPDPVTRLLALCTVGQAYAGPRLLSATQARTDDTEQDVRLAARYASERCLGKEATMPSIIHRVQSLQRFDVFSGLGIRELRAVASIIERAGHGQGETLIRRGEPLAGLHLISAGAITARTQDGQQREIGAGEFFGALELFSDRPAECDYVAARDVDLLVIRSAHFLEIMKLYPLIGVNTCRYLAGLLQKQQTGVDARGQGPDAPAPE